MEGLRSKYLHLRCTFGAEISNAFTKQNDAAVRIACDIWPAVGKAKE